MALQITRYDVVMELIEDLLGTVPRNRSIYASYIATKGRELMERDGQKGIPLASGVGSTPDAIVALVGSEPDTIEEIEERGWTGFHTDEQGPFLFDYACKGFLKEAARTLKEYDPSGESEGSEDGEESEEEETPKKGRKKAGAGVVKQLQDKVSRYVFVQPRRVRLPPVDGVNERPLRALTAQGPRVTVTRSDVIKAGARLSFTLAVLKGGQISEGLLRDVLSYAQFQGFGQWRSGGWGRASLISLKKVS